MENGEAAKTRDPRNTKLVKNRIMASLFSFLLFVKLIWDYARCGACMENAWYRDRSHENATVLSGSEKRFHRDIVSFPACSVVVLQQTFSKGIDRQQLVTKRSFCMIH